MADGQPEALGTANAPSPQDEIGRYYSVEQGTDAEFLKPWNKVASKVAIDIVLRRKLQQATFLDLGCSVGMFLDHCRGELAKRGVTVNGFGVDLNPRSMAIAQSKGFQVIHGDVTQKLDIPDAFADIVSAQEIIEHLFQPTMMLQEAYRVLKPGGSLVLSTPNAFHVVRLLDYAQGKLHDPLTDPSSDYFPEHVRLYSFRIIERLLRKHGFTPRSVGFTTLRGKQVVMSNMLLKHFWSQGIVVAGQKAG